MWRGKKDDWDLSQDIEKGSPGTLSGPAEDLPPHNEAWFAEGDLFSAQLRSGDGLFAALMAGSLAGALCVVLWAFITYHVGTIFVVVALGLGYVVGIAVRWAGGGTRPVFGIIAGAITLIFSFVGLMISALIVLALQQEVPIEELLQDFDPEFLAQSVQHVFSSVTLLVLLFAVYQSYRMAVVSPEQFELPVEQKELPDGAEGDPRPRG